MAISDHEPKRVEARQGKNLYRYNVHKVSVTDAQTGKLRSQYEYDEVEIEGEVTPSKVITAVRTERSSKKMGDVGATLSKYENVRKQLGTISLGSLDLNGLRLVVGQILDVLEIDYKE